MKNYPKNCKTVVSLFLVLCSLFIINCEIDPDYLKKIDNEVAWHNAKKLEVSIAFPPSWGTSNPGQGLIQRNVIDIRLGYTFEIDFTPVTEFSLVGWRAYATEDLTLAKLGINNWLQNLNYLDNEWRKTQEGLEPIDQLSIGEGLDIEISNISHRGGRGTFKININKDVTLIPYCNTEAYIISSEPRDNKQGLWPVMSPIILYFNAPLDPDMTWTLGGEMIKINAKDSEGNYSIPLNNYYETPVYQSRFGLHTVTISPRITNPPGDNLEVEMTIGPNIFNANDPNQEYKMTVDKIYWTTTVRDLPQGSIAAWGAKYENNSITVSWTIDGDGEVKGYWQEGWGSINDLPSNKTIPNIIPVNSENIRQGMSVSGVREYRIKLQLVASDIIIDEKELKIWNVPGMNVSDTVVITEINSPAALAAIPNGATGQYVLTSDITVDNHTPIPNFTGNFYGNGHTITINSFTNSTYTGLFGYVSGNAQIRDLTVRINGNIQAGSNTTHAGGLAGFIGGVEKDDKNNVLAAAKITNCIITGGQLSIITNSTEPVFLGGMTGQIESGVVISNSHVALNIELLSRGDGDVYAGGVAAKIGIGEDPNNDQVYMLIYPIDPDDPDFIFPGLPENIIARHDILFDIQAVGNVSCIKDGDFDGLMFAGGIIGSCVSNGGRLLRLGYGGTLRTGRHSSLVIFSSKFLNIFGGGIAGYVRYPRMELCVFERGGKIEVTQDNSEARFGGIAGLLKEGISASEYSLQTSTSRGDINIVVTGYALVGGICGEIIGSSEQESVRLNDCVYEQGSIYFRTEAHWRNVVGGVIGYLDTFGAITNSYSHAARIETLVSFGGLSLGGFAGYLEDVIVKNCGNTSPIIMNRMGQPTTIGVEMGGFAGRASGWEGVELENCWSKGDVNSWGAGSLYTGGLLGRTTNVKLTGCWAEGNISAYSLSTGRYDFFTGGLVGASVNTDISESRASGSVTAMTDVFSNLNIDVGGLVGSSMGGSIKNSYAEGNVSAVNQRNSPANIRAGGLIGHATNYFTTPHREIEFNFARGLVSAQSGGSGNVHAGGIIGLIDSGSITNNIALNRDVLALGGSNRVAARVYANTGTYSGSSNYSRSDMRLTTGNATADTTIEPGGTGLETIHGQNMTETAAFWTGLGFSPPIWNFDNFNRQRFPVLRGL